LNLGILGKESTAGGGGGVVALWTPRACVGREVEKK